MSVPSASKRPLPPARLNWDLPPLPLETLDLPPLPAVNDAELARQARTTAQHIPAAAGRTGNLRREDELSSYGRLEYVGDAVLHDLYARTLYRQFPRADSGLLSKMRGILSSNISHSYLAWYYYLDRDIIDEPEPERPSANFRARREMQSINADLFEARIGALALDGQTSEIETWLSLFILGAKEALEAVAGANEAEMGTSRRNRNRKRKAETGQFCDGREMDPRTYTRRISHLDSCPSTTDSVFGWDERVGEDRRWHSHLIAYTVDNQAHTLGCGIATALADSHNRALTNAVALRSFEAVRPFLSLSVASQPFLRERKITHS